MSLARYLSKLGALLNNSGQVQTAAVEVERQAIRTKYAEMQSAIDAASTVEQIKGVMP